MDRPAFTVFLEIYSMLSANAAESRYYHNEFPHILWQLATVIDMDRLKTEGVAWKTVPRPPVGASGTRTTVDRSRAP